MKLFEPLRGLWFPVTVLCREVTTLFSLPIAWQTQIQDCSQKGSGEKAHFLNDMHFRIHTVRTWTQLLFFLVVYLVYFVFKVNRVFVLFYSFSCLSLPSFVLYFCFFCLFHWSLSLLFLQRLWLPTSKRCVTFLN